MISMYKQVIRVKKHMGLPPSHLDYLDVFLLGSEEPSLNLLRLAKLQHTNSSPISNCWRSKLATLFRAVLF